MLNQKLLVALFSAALALAPSISFARQGADDGPNHEANEHAAGHEANEHASGNNQGGDKHGRNRRGRDKDNVMPVPAP